MGCMLRRGIFLTLIFLIFPTCLLGQQQNTDLREITIQIKDDFVSAVNTRALAKLTQNMTDDVFIVLDNAQTFHSKEAFSNYISTTRILDKYKVTQFLIENVVIDKEIQVYDDKHFLTIGTADFIYHMVRGKVLKVPVRWMATFTQNAQDQWQISSYQATINVLDNPWIDQMRHDFYMICFITLLIGFIIGIAWKKWMRKSL